jgi:hypothetical protein
MSDLQRAAAILQQFSGSDLTSTLAKVEANLHGVTLENCSDVLESCGARNEVLAAGALMKQLAGQINVVIHALGIILCLPHLLDPGESVQYVSLGAGNTGRPFDLETSHRIAEFKFIRWQGGAEAIRQNSLFKDFYYLSQDVSPKRKYLYVLHTEQPLKFLNSRRALSSVLSHSVKLKNEFAARFGEQYRVVRDYYLSRANTVVVQDVSPLVPELDRALAETLE